jgi:hypothetical protein
MRCYFAWRVQGVQGLDGNLQAALKVRVFGREWFGGQPRLEPGAPGRKVGGRGRKHQSGVE